MRTTQRAHRPSQPGSADISPCASPLPTHPDIRLPVERALRAICCSVLVRAGLDACVSARPPCQGDHFFKIDVHTQRSEERRVGKECVSTCRSRWSPYHEKKNKKTTQI